MNCPHCQQSLIQKDYEHFSVSTCNQCAGIWLSPDQLVQILAVHDQVFAPEVIQKTMQAAHPGISDSESSLALSCPICSSVMNKINYDYSSGIIVNVCPKGEGLWFDKDELESVQIYMEHWDDEESANMTTLLAKLKQERQDEKSREDTIVIHPDPGLKGILNSLFGFFHVLKRVNNGTGKIPDL